MIKAILFDFGGVVYEHPKEVIPAVIAQIYGLPVETAKIQYSKYRIPYYLGTLPTDKLIASLSADFKSNKIIEEVKDLWLKHYLQLAKPNQEVLNIIRKLRKKHKVYLVSNTTEMSNICNSKTGIYNFFDDLFMSYQLGIKKPDPEIYQKVISSIGLKPGECIFIDDDPKNLVPARQMGITTVLFNVLTDSPVELKKSLTRLGMVV